MLDPSGRMSRDILLFHEKVSRPRFQSGNDILPGPIALTLALVTCYFQWS